MTGSDEPSAGSAAPRRRTCRVCEGEVEEFLDLGTQPISQRFPDPEDTTEGFRFRLAVGCCSSCSMVQLMEEVPRDELFGDDYPFTSSGSRYLTEYFTGVAQHLLATELNGQDRFIVEIGCNDGTMLRNIHGAGVRHLGFEPSRQVAELATSTGVRVRNDFFEESTVREVIATDGPADVVFSSYTISGIADLGSIFEPVLALLAPNGVFVFEDAYLGDVIARTTFDQIYDEHCFLFSARSVRATANRFGFELVDVQRIPVRGGGMRYVLARSGARMPSTAVAELLTEEAEAALTAPETLGAFADRVRQIRTDLRTKLVELRDSGKRVVGYGATAKATTVLQFCGIGPDLIEFISDSTPAKHGKVTPARRIPIRPHSDFASDYPDYALLFAWFHTEEITAGEGEFAEHGGRWLMYVPDVHVF